MRACLTQTNYPILLLLSRPNMETYRARVRHRTVDRYINVALEVTEKAVLGRDSSANSTWQCASDISNADKYFMPRKHQIMLQTIRRLFLSASAFDIYRAQ